MIASTSPPPPEFDAGNLLDANDAKPGERAAERAKFVAWALGRIGRSDASIQLAYEDQTSDLLVVRGGPSLNSDLVRELNADRRWRVTSDVGDGPNVLRLHVARERAPAKPLLRAKTVIGLLLLLLFAAGLEYMHVRERLKSEGPGF